MGPPSGRRSTSRASACRTSSTRPSSAASTWARTTSGPGSSTWGCGWRTPPRPRSAGQKSIGWCHPSQWGSAWLMTTFRKYWRIFIQKSNFCLYWSLLIHRECCYSFVPKFSFLSENTFTLRHFMEVAEFLDIALSQNGKCFVNCVFGRSRSAPTH